MLGLKVVRIKFFLVEPMIQLPKVSISCYQYQRNNQRLFPYQLICLLVVMEVEHF